MLSVSDKKAGCALASRRRWILWTFLLLPLWMTPAEPLWAQGEGSMVSEIKIRGNKRVDSATIFYYIKTEVGRPLSHPTIRKDIEQIYSLGQFTDIQVETEPADDGGVQVIFVVREIPSVAEITFVGNENLDDEDLREEILIKRGITFKEHLIKDTIQKLKAFYSDKAYFLAEVDVQTKLNANGQMDVTIHIKEGEKIKIGEIQFVGIKAFDKDDLEDQMETKEKGWFSWIDESGIYKKDVLKIDILRLESYYQDHGYVRARVGEPKVELDREEMEIVITIEIEEGRLYRIGKVEIEDVPVFSPKEMRESIKIKTGDVYKLSQLREAILGVTEKFSHKGYAYAEVNPKTDIDDQKRIVDLKIQVNPGRKVYVGRINIHGNTKTRDNVIRREFRLKEGQLFDSKKLKRTKQRINNLGYFEDVKIDTHRGDSPEFIDIDTTVTERPTGSISFGAGFSSVDKVIFNASIAQDNFLGRGQRLNFSTQLSARRSNFNLRFTEPRIFDSEVSMGIDAFNRRSNFFSFSSRSQGGGVRLGKNLSETDWAGLNYRFAQIEISGVLNPTPLLRNETRTTSRIGATFIRDTRDNFINPTMGWRHVVRFEFAGSILGGADFFKTGYEITYYKTLIGKLVGAVHGAINHGQGYNNEELPAFERYFMGGPNSLRGYTLRQVGPLTAQGNPLGGEQSLLFNAELQYPITKGFRVFAFYDRGNVYGDGPNLTTTDRRFNLDKMRDAVGGGIRFFSPFGPISLAYGVKLDRRLGESAGEFVFSAGNAF